MHQAPALEPLPVVIAAAQLDLGRAVDDAQALEQLRLIHAQLEADHAAHGQADIVCRTEIEVLDQCNQVSAESGNAVALPGFVRTAVTAHIRDDHPVAGGKCRDLFFPVQRAGTETVDQQQRYAVAIFLIVQVATFVFEIGHAYTPCQACSGAANGASSGAVSNVRSSSMRICVAGPSGLSLFEYR
ncbi:hypothetical protein D3C86_1598770 [compost metagenome]